MVPFGENHAASGRVVRDLRCAGDSFTLEVVISGQNRGSFRPNGYWANFLLRSTLSSGQRRKMFIVFKAENPQQLSEPQPTATPTGDLLSI